MIAITRDEHLETLVGSINKMFAIARNKGVINNKEITLVNLIHKLLRKGAYSGGQEQQLLSLYYRILNKYKFLCKAPLTRNYYFEQVGINNTYIPDPCYDAPKYEKIFFWQEESYLTIYTEVMSKVLVQGFLLTKENDSYPVFDVGRMTHQGNYGKVCFALTETLASDDYRILNILEMDVTHAFTRVYLPEIDVLLFVSNSNYSYEDTHYKIRKLTTPFVEGIFDDQFNDIFE